jgi:glycosyltransferase involved in cell wall biosynthesis
MKIFYISKLFSGLEQSVLSNKWKPTGVPTIYKIIEKLDKNYDVKFILTSKDGHTNWPFRKVKKIKFDILKNNFFIIPGANRFFLLPKKIKVIFREIYQLVKITSFYFKYRPKLMYFDHSNIISASFFSRLTKASVIFRIMGINPSMRNTLKSNRFTDIILRFCYRSPFDFIISTCDGSGDKEWINKIKNPSTKLRSMINGVNLKNYSSEKPKELKNINLKKTIVLFVGRLDQTKGCLQFVLSFSEALKKTGNQLHGLIIGDGIFTTKTKKLINELNLNNHITLIAKLEHKHIIAAHEISSIYISLNRWGNLSVANLEAMKLGQCIIMPKSNFQSNIDLDTDKLIPINAAIRVKSADDIHGISNGIISLHKNIEMRKNLSENMIKCSKKFIPNWKKRISMEMKIIDSLLHE